MKDTSAPPSASRLLKAWRSLEEIGFLWGLGAGVLIGGLAGGVALFQAAGALGLTLGLLLLTLAAPLGFLGRAVVAPLRAPEPAPRPGPAPFSVTEDIPGLLAMVALPGGELWMGSADDDDSAYTDERPRHRVRVDGFLIAQAPVTRALYRQVMGEGHSEWDTGDEHGRLPANYLTWGDAARFCNALSKRQGLRPCYRRILIFWRWNRAADGYRLPTEADWECATRAGTTTRWFFGDDERDLGDYAWFGGNSGKAVQPVAEKEPNPWRLHDLLGNVWEWCWDHHGRYRAALADNPTGPAIGLSRVFRGGSAWVGPGFLRSAFRYRRAP